MILFSTALVLRGILVRFCLEVFWRSLASNGVTTLVELLALLRSRLGNGSDGSST